MPEMIIGDRVLARAIDTRRSPRHPVLRTATIVGLALAAAGAAGLIAWLLYQRETFTFAFGHEAPDRAEQSFAGRGLRILTQHPYFVPGICAAIAGVLASAALVVAMLRRKRWAYLVTALGCSLAIVPAWLLRGQIWDLEASFARSARWAARSPYVAAATNLTIAVTAVLGVIALLALASFVTAPRATTSSDAPA